MRAGMYFSAGRSNSLINCSAVGWIGSAYRAGPTAMTAASSERITDFRELLTSRLDADPEFWLDAGALRRYHSPCYTLQFRCLAQGACVEVPSSDIAAFHCRYPR